MCKGLWRCLELLSIQAGVLVEWQREMGADFEACAQFLTPTTRQMESYPCMHPVGGCRCRCRHRVVHKSADEAEAVCECGEGCEPIVITPKDLVVYVLDGVKIGAAIREAFGFAGSVSLEAGQREARQLGMRRECRTPVFFYVPVSEGTTLKEVERLQSAMGSPYVLLTPTDRFCGPLVQRRGGAAQLGLAEAVAVEGQGLLRVKAEASGLVNGVFSEVERRRMSQPDTGILLKEIHREIASVRTEYHELRESKARLEQMQAQGLFKFTQKVDAKSFSILCTLLAAGDVSKASRELGMNESTLRKLVAGWWKRGSVYATMADVVRWRKKVGRTEMVPLNEAVLAGKAPSVDYPALISDVLDGVLSMTEGNWQDKAEELAEMLRGKGA